VSGVRIIAGVANSDGENGSHIPVVFDLVKIEKQDPRLFREVGDLVFHE
jgi:hypothetical protein